MQFGRRIRRSHIVLAGLAVLGGTLARAQPGRANRTAVRRQDQRSVTYGDITLTGFRRSSGNFEIVTIEGPGTQVNSVDEKTHATNRINASLIKAFMSKDKQKKGTVARIEFSGGVRFAGQRPPPTGKGIQSLNATGSKGTWFKEEGRLLVNGPVDYYAEQPAREGDGKEWVRGVSDEATYFEEKHLLILQGHVKARLFDPVSMREPSPFNGDEVRIDMSGEAMSFEVINRDDSGSIEIKPKPREKKEKGKS